jgi:hypothetical protein
VALRRQNKKCKTRKDSLNQDDYQFIDPEAIVEYLELMNDFIKNSIGEEPEDQRRNSNISDVVQVEEFVETRERRFSSRVSEDMIEI